MRTCGSCGELIGYTVKTCPFCGVSASDKEMTEIKHEKIKQDMIYEEYCKKQDEMKAERRGFLRGLFFGRND